MYEKRLLGNTGIHTGMCMCVNTGAGSLNLRVDFEKCGWDGFDCGGQGGEYWYPLLVRWLAIRSWEEGAGRSEGRKGGACVLWTGE
jgi:hypothetical protein